jgi:hypothetical protein
MVEVMGRRPKYAHPTPPPPAPVTTWQLGKLSVMMRERGWCGVEGGVGGL